MGGQRLCRAAFAHLVGLSQLCIARHAKYVYISPSFLPYTTKHNDSHTGKLGPQCKTVDGFLSYVLSSFTMECPPGQRSEEGAPLMILKSDTSRIKIYNDYVQAFPRIADAANEWIISLEPATR